MPATLAPRDPRRRLLWTACIVSSLVMLDSNLVAVSLPTIARGFNVTFSDTQWVIGAYVLPFTALLLAAGSLADLHGRRRAMLGGLTLFTLGSLACGLATSIVALDAARAAQGIGAAFLLTASLAVINHAFRGPERAGAFAAWGICLGLAVTMGPVLGGLINDWFGWRWAFLINLPIGVVLLGATVLHIGESRDPDAERLDGAGALTLGASLLFLTFALIEGNERGWGSLVIVTSFGAGALALLGFVAVELRQARPMLDLALFRSRRFLGAVVAMAGFAAGAQVMVFSLPPALQSIYGFSPAQAGLAMLPFAVPTFLAPRLAGARLASFSDRAVLAAGLLLTAAGDIGLAALSTQPYGYFALVMFVTGCGAGLLNGLTAQVLQGTVPPDRGGMASGLSATTRFIALLVSVAGFGALFEFAAVDRLAGWVMAQNLPNGTAMTLARHLAAGDVGDALASLPAAARATALAEARQVSAFSFAMVAGAAAIAAALAAALTWRLMQSRPATVTRAHLMRLKQPAPVLE